MNRRSFFALIVGGISSCAMRSQASTITLAAAASLRTVLPELIRAFEAAHRGVHVSATYGGSGDLRKQVEGGAPIDAVLFAAARPVDALIAAGQAVATSRRVLASNQLILVGPTESPPLTFATLDILPPSAMLAMGDPGAVPAGQYARDYLTTLGKWPALAGRLVLGSDVAAVLAYARRGEVAAAIVYRTEIQGVPDLMLLDEARGPSAPHPLVVAATLRGAPPLAGAFLDDAASTKGQRIFASYGFGPP